MSPTNLRTGGRRKFRTFRDFQRLISHARANRPFNVPKLWIIFSRVRSSVIPFHFTRTKRYQKTKRVVRLGRVNRSSFTINQSSFVSRSSVPCAADTRTASPVTESPETELRYVVATCRTRDYAQGLYTLRPSAPPQAPVHPARSRLFGERVVETPHRFHSGVFRTGRFMY